MDEQTRCVHYSSELDVVAIKFKCCGAYYPCYSCHEETADHPAEVWPRESWNENAILCGRCGYTMTIQEYLDNPAGCPHCRGAFNPRCANHYHLYFDIP